ncbi:TPA: hypothetical protein DD455_03525, partial [Candidatus Shapirobacteria bacterium]|nr:hypothetical protein [Candidatus Shapirobacteria bacterium]
KMFNIIFATLSFSAAVASAVAAWYSYSLSKNIYLGTIHQMFFNIISVHTLDEKGEAKHIVMICNFCEYLCGLVRKKIISKKDVDQYLEVFEEKPYVSYAIQRYKVNKRIFPYYVEWLKKNNLFD